jgi:YfiH family protein
MVGGIRAIWTDSSSGDLRPRRGEHRTALSGALDGAAPGVREVHFAEQVHGSKVATVAIDIVTTSGDVEVVCDGEADALVSTSRSVALAVLTADCAPIALASPEGVFAAVHAGWRGLCRGVVAAAVDAMREQGATAVSARRGPCIRVCCYEFSGDDLDAVADLFGPEVRAQSRRNLPALDLPAAVSAALAAEGVREEGSAEVCTACGEGYFSHRARRDVGRQALLVWREPVPA